MDKDTGKERHLFLKERWEKGLQTKENTDIGQEKRQERKTFVEIQERKRKF